MSHGFLGAVDGVCEQVAALADALGVSPILEFDPFELKKITQGFEQFVFLYGFHDSMMRHCSGEYRDAFRQQITTSEMIYSSWGGAPARSNANRHSIIRIIECRFAFERAGAPPHEL